MTKIRTLFGAGGVALLLSLPNLGAAQVTAGEYLAARFAASSGDFDDAALYLEKALRSDPGNAELKERAVMANMSLGKIGRASEYAQSLLDQGARSQIGQMALIAQDASTEDFDAILAAIVDQRGFGPLADGLVAAWAELGRGNMNAALEAFDVVAQLDGLAPFAGYHRALAFASVGDYQSADALMETNARGGMERTRRGLMARAEVLSQLGRNEDAIALLDELFGQTFDPGVNNLRTALETGQRLPFTHVQSPRDGMAEVFFTLASALSNEDNDDITLLYSRVAEYLRPDHVPAKLLSAELLENLALFELAIETYDSIPDDHLSFHAAELGRAEALRRLDRKEDTLAVLTQLAKTHGDLPSVHSALGGIHRELKNYPEAVAANTAALDLYPEITPGQWFLFYTRGIAHERNGDWPAAEADFRQALALDPEQPNVLNYLGYSLVEKQSKLDEALNMIERAVAARPNSGFIVDSLGWVLYRLGRYDEAVVHMERAAELMPVDPVVNDHLGDVYWAVGRTLEAEFQWSRALSFVDLENVTEDADPERIRRKLEVGLDQVLQEEGAAPLHAADAAD